MIEQQFIEHQFMASAVACPNCKARPGTRCKRPSGHTTAALHAERKELADNEFIALYGEDARIYFDKETKRSYVRSSPKGAIVAYAKELP